MPVPKRIIISYSLLTVSSLLALFFIFKTRQLNMELKRLNDQIQAMEDDYSFNQPSTLETIDSLLLSGRYFEAISAYQKQLAQADEPDFARALQLRMDLARQLQRKSKNQEEKQDTSSMVSEINPDQLITLEELRQFDSLNFALDKANMRINYLERQLKENTTGSYLTFNTSKGIQVHYVGQVKSKKANGRGVALLSSGSRYEGEWQNNLRHGKGAFYWPDGQYYEGQYKDDKRHGLGTYHWPNGEKFTGLWEKDKRNGEGTFFGEKGKVRGIWKNDELVEVDKQ